MCLGTMGNSRGVWAVRWGRCSGWLQGMDLVLVYSVTPRSLLGLTALSTTFSSSISSTPPPLACPRHFLQGRNTKSVVDFLSIPGKITILVSNKAAREWFLPVPSLALCHGSFLYFPDLCLPCSAGNFEETDQISCFLKVN